MKDRIKFKLEEGFSLVELMIVVAIIGILASLAVPKFRTFQAKARQAEAKTNLSHIFTLEEAYYADEERYAALPDVGANKAVSDKCDTEKKNSIGFAPVPCNQKKTRYVYSTTSADANTFTARALSSANTIVPNCTVADAWTIDHDRTLTNSANALKNCAN